MKKMTALFLALLLLAASLPSFAASGWDAPSVGTGSHSTDKLPREQDFDWFWNRQTGELTTNVPDGAKMITEPDRISGGWMVFLMRRPNTDPYANYWNMDLQLNGRIVEATQYWSGAVENGAFSDFSKANTNPYSGTLVPGSMLMTLKDGFGDELIVPQWFEYNGAQYGIGFYHCVFPVDEKDPLGFIVFYRP